MKHLMTIFLSCIIAGCAVNNINDNFALDKNSQDGLVIGSITQDITDGPATYSIFYIDSNMADSKQKMLYSNEQALGGLIPKSFHGSDLSDGRLFVIKLSAGEHSIVSWQLNNGSGARINPSKKLIPRTFNVKAGEITYIGNLHMKIASGRNLFGITINSDALPEFRDESARDVDLFKNKYPTLASSPINTSLLKKGLWEQ